MTLFKATVKNDDGTTNDSVVEANQHDKDETRRVVTTGGVTEVRKGQWIVNTENANIVDVVDDEVWHNLGYSEVNSPDQNVQPADVNAEDQNAVSNDHGNDNQNV